MKKLRVMQDEQADTDMTPMLDIVFIMLIFFIVTTSFTKETGVDITRPSTIPNDLNEIRTVQFVIDQNNTISFDGREIDFRAIAANVERIHAQFPEIGVIISVHPFADTKTLIKVVDATRNAGIQQVNVSTTAISN